MKVALVILLCFAIAAGAFATLRQSHPSAYMRGQKIAQESGCVGCHDPKHDAEPMSNPGSLRGVIPSFHSGVAVSGFWVNDIDDFREYVINGSSQRALDEAKKFAATEKSGFIRMPAYDTQLSESQIADLYTYYNRSNAFREPQGDAAEKGLKVAREQGCFACHGDYGLSGVDNPGSFKGYIPSWEGEDFEDLARNDEEIREWIHRGSLARIRNNPVGNYFMSRQKIHMPAYQQKISEAEINNLVAYIRALPTLDKAHPVETKPVETAPDHSARGEFLFQNAGCVTCHKPEGVEGFTDRHGEDIPSQAHIAYRLKVSADILQERQSQTQQPEALCHGYRSFADEYHQIETLILNGAEATPATAPLAGTYIDTQHLTAMPAWSQRANPESSPNGNEDRDSLIDYLLMQSDAAVRPEVIDQWLIAAATCIEKPAQSPSKKDDDIRRQQVLDRIEFFDRQEKLFDHLPVVTFFSDEVHLVDQVGYFRDKDVDYWLLRQATNLPNTAEVLAKGHFTNRIKFVIAVDKTDVDRYRAYYFSTRGDSPPDYVSETFSAAHLVDCFGCHASGPRLVRPGVAPGIPRLVDRDWNLIKQFNHDIRSYGDVATPWPTGQTPLPPDWMEPVTMPVCQTCHQEDGLRAPLRRYHTQTLSNLIDTYEQDSGYFVKRVPGQLAIMPPVVPLSDSGRLDLLDWTNLSEWRRKRPRNQPHP